jgi:hypothetical protein
MYKSFANVGGSNQSEFRINPKYALGTTLLGPGFIFDIDRVVQSFSSKISNKIFKDNIYLYSIDNNSRFGEDSWLLNPLHNLYYLQYPIHIIDFVIINPNEKYRIVDNPCEQLYFPNAINQTEIICGCGQYYSLTDDGHSCISNCPE